MAILKHKKRASLDKMLSLTGCKMPQFFCGKSSRFLTPNHSTAGKFLAASAKLAAWSYAKDIIHNKEVTIGEG